MSQANDEIEKPEASAPSEGEAPVESDAAVTQSDAAVTPGEPQSAPKKKKKKKRKVVEPDAEGESLPADGAEPALDATGAERPAFHAWFPRNEELQTLVRAFEVGNYALVRERAPKLAQSAESEKVRAAARELLARIEPDPLMKYLLLAATLLLVFLAFYAYRTHGH